MIYRSKYFEWVSTDGPNDNVNKILKPDETFSKEAKASIKHGDTIEVSPKCKVSKTKIDF